MKKVAIIGLGNPVRSDEAVGIYVIEQLQEHLGNCRSVSLFDAGISVFEILFKLRDYSQLILIDSSTQISNPLGTWVQIPERRINDLAQPEPWAFLDNLKWEQTLAYAKKVLKEHYPKKVEVYVVPIHNTRLQVNMSEEVKKAGDGIVKQLSQKLMRQ